MAARSCLLCGKALSRIWAGTGEDFCSREHRNQYRLRAGMDRLLEANKVASVMRRREVPRHIPTVLLRSRGAADHRGFFDPRPPRDPGLAAFSPSPLQPAEQPDFTATRDFLPPRAVRSPAETGQWNSTSLPFAAQAPLAPPLKLKMPAQVEEAPPSARRRNTADCAPVRRFQAATRWRSDTRPVLGQNLSHAKSPRALTAGARPARPATAPCKGRALRVSMAAGFRVPESKVRRLSLAAPEIAGFIWPGIRSYTPRAAAPSKPPAAADIEIPERPILLPAAPPPDWERRFEWPGVFGISLSAVTAADRRRTASVPFGPPDESLAKERR